MTSPSVAGCAEPQISPLRYAPVEMTKGRSAIDLTIRCWMRRNADLSNTLRFGRDDKGGRRLTSPSVAGCAEPQISPLRYAPATLSKGGRRLTSPSVTGCAEPQISPLRYAPV